MKLSDIELVLERWLIAFKKYGHMVEIFENPSKSEFASVGSNFRFILDSKRKKSYIWNATGAIHSDAWIHIKKELNDARHVYESDDLLTGTMEGTSLHFYAAWNLSPNVRAGLKRHDWSFAKKYVDIDKLWTTLKKI